MLRKELRAAIPYLDAHKSLFSHLGKYFAYAMDNLVPEANKKKYTSEKMRKKKYS